MATFWITFRLENETVGGRTYSQRYDALIEAVKAHRASTWWYEPTSFWLIDSNSTKAQIASSIKAAISSTHDLAVVGSMEVTGATLVGNAKKITDLRKLVPGLVTA